MRNVVKSVRLDESLPLSSLPHGNLNPLINELLTLYFEDEEVYNKILEIDPRLIKGNAVRSTRKVEKPVETVEKPVVPTPSPVVKEEEPLSLIDSILPS